MTHPQFKTQISYDKNHQKMKALRQKYFDQKIDREKAYEKLTSEMGFGRWGAMRTVTVWDEEIQMINKLKKEYKSKKVKGTEVIERLLRIASYDKFESEKLMEAWDNEPKKEKSKNKSYSPFEDSIEHHKSFGK